MGKRGGGTEGGWQEGKDGVSDREEDREGQTHRSRERTCLSILTYYEFNKIFLSQ